MARIRTIKPEFWTSEQVMECSPTARLLFIGMWNFCDDAGIHPASAKTLKAEVFPADDINATDVQRLVDDLLTNGLIVEYESAGKRYWQVTGWHHQKIEKPNYKHPKQEIQQPIADDSTTSRRPFADHSTPEGKGMEGKGKESKPSAPAAPIADISHVVRKPAVQFKTFIAECKVKSEKPIPEDDTVFDWAEKAGVPDDFLRLAWLEFRDRYAGSTKRYRDWRMVFRNAVRDNWYGIWFCDDSGQMVLTSKGRTIQQTMREAA